MLAGRLKVMYDQPIEVGSYVKFKENVPARVGVGQVCSIVGSGEKIKYEVYLLNKRFKNIIKSDDTYKRRTIHSKYCKHVEINSTIFHKKSFEIGDIVCHNLLGFKRYGVITGFTHPDGLESTSYMNGYNGSDLIECVQVNKIGLTRYRDGRNKIKKFTCCTKRLKLCEVDIWDEKGVLIK